ncbi:UNVERIFIED_ORG: lambda repressor-like predicted transcriptional regulator [Atlantibacter sp. SORGH_AS 304]|nr:lambda repressor-like predicted transcriptional regulator [Atlantibacter sp. SORGH_AS_0304]
MIGTWRLANALTRRWPKGERLIAEALGTQPDAIWPSRYRRDKQEQGIQEEQGA